MQKLVTVQRKNGTIEEMPDWMANDTRLQKKHGWRVINIPTTVEELKAEFHDLEPVNEPVVEQEFISEAPKKRGRPTKN